MRDILFRGKRVGGNDFVYGNLIHVDDYCCILEREEDLHPMDAPYLDGEIGWIDGKATPVVPETIGQFTGLCDRNGNKIFEGDIIRYGYDEAHFVVCYKGGAFRMLNYVDGCSSAIWPAYAWMILGNIHDNPELLEEEE